MNDFIAWTSPSMATSPTKAVNKMSVLRINGKITHKNLPYTTVYAKDLTVQDFKNHKIFRTAKGKCRLVSSISDEYFYHCPEMNNGFGMSFACHAYSRFRVI